MNGAICIDASVAVKWLLPEKDSEKALALLEAALAAREDLTGPPHLPVEVTSAIHKRFRQGEITLVEARDRLQAFSRIPIDLTYPTGLAERALELAAELDWAYPYDAFYLAVGEMLDCDVWTADEEFYEHAHAGYPRLRLLSSYGES
jgi:predicted nucleic acid-binding protein